MANQNILVLSDLSADYEQIRAQIVAQVATKQTWKGTLTTQTSQTLIDLLASVTTFAQSRIIRNLEDVFSETSVSDDAIRSIAQMQGIRMSRKLPATIGVTLSCAYDVTLSPLTQFVIAGQYWFNRDQVEITAGVPLETALYQGNIRSYATNGDGTNNQYFVSEEDAFQVSDQDVQVLSNGVIIPKVYGGLWNYRDQPAYADSTTSDGRLFILFGTNQFGFIPNTNDNITLRFPVTLGDGSNNQALVDAAVSVDGFSDITGTVTSNPQGGAPDQNILSYKNLSSGSFGTFSSAVTANQYKATVGIYPGIIDAYTQAQREINPSDVKWMNIIRVSGLTTDPWSQQQKTDFCKYMQTVTMYAAYFVWVDAIEVPRDIEVDVFFFNNVILTEGKSQAEAAVTDLFAKKPGILMTNFYESDLDSVIKQSTNGGTSYVIVRSPTYPMIVTAPESPVLTYEIVPGGGTLGTYVYSYGMATVNADGEEGPPSNWIAPQVIDDGETTAIKLTWPTIGGATKYRLYGRKSGQIGLIAEILATDPLVFVDNGSITPSGNPPNNLSEVPIRYNSLRTLKINAYYAERQQRIINT